MVFPALAPRWKPRQNTVHPEEIWRTNGYDPGIHGLGCYGRRSWQRRNFYRRKTCATPRRQGGPPARVRADLRWSSGIRSAMDAEGKMRILEGIATNRYRTRHSRTWVLWSAILAAQDIAQRSASNRAPPRDIAIARAAASNFPHLLNCRFAMAISKELLEILVCPICKAVVELKPDNSGLKCVECHRVYPIRDEIPVMLVDEAKVEE